jgi:hypothetical protein
MAARMARRREAKNTHEIPNENEHPACIRASLKYNSGQAQSGTTIHRIAKCATEPYIAVMEIPDAPSR